MVKDHDPFCKNNTVRNCVMLLPPFYDVNLPIFHASMTLDGVMSFKRVIRVINTCNCLRSSKFGRDFFSAMAVNLKKLKAPTAFPSFLCVRIEIDQLLCVISYVIIYWLSVSCKLINHSR